MFRSRATCKMGCFGDLFYGACAYYGGRGFAGSSSLQVQSLGSCRGRSGQQFCLQFRSAIAMVFVELVRRPIPSPTFRILPHTPPFRTSTNSPQSLPRASHTPPFLARPRP